MHELKLRIPADFLLEHARMGWRELERGLANGLIDAAAVIECAIDEVGRVAEPTKEVIELAGSDDSDSIAELVAALAASEPSVSEASIQKKWLYLTLAWLYERRDAIADPLQIVEEVYEQFGHPAEMASFIRYMPMVGPDLGSREANEHRMISRWKEYVDAARERYQP